MDVGARALTCLLRSDKAKAATRSTGSPLSYLFVFAKLAGSGQGQNRTADTRIFSPLLYQLSYLAASPLGEFPSRRDPLILNVRPTPWNPCAEADIRRPSVSQPAVGVTVVPNRAPSALRYALAVALCPMMNRDTNRNTGL